MSITGGALFNSEIWKKTLNPRDPGLIRLSMSTNNKGVCVSVGVSTSLAIVDISLPQRFLRRIWSLEVEKENGCATLAYPRD